MLDVNGTLALDGSLIPGVGERLAELARLLELHFLTADTHGRQRALDAQLGVAATILGPDAAQEEQKAAYVRRLGVEAVVAVGNGANDALMLRAAALGIAVLGPEGLAGAALREADIVTASISDALDLLLNPRRIVATLRR